MLGIIELGKFVIRKLDARRASRSH